MVCAGHLSPPSGLVVRPGPAQRLSKREKFFVTRIRPLPNAGRKLIISGFNSDTSGGNTGAGSEALSMPAITKVFRKPVAQTSTNSVFMANGYLYIYGGKVISVFEIHL